MKAHATGTQRFTFNPLTVLALAAGILLAVAVLVVNDVIDLPFTSESTTTSMNASNDIEQRRERYIELKFQLPAIDFGTSAQSIEQMHFLEQNLSLPSGGLPLPVMSVAQMLFLEQNIWEYSTLPATDAEPPAAPPGSYPANQLD